MTPLLAFISESVMLWVGFIGTAVALLSCAVAVRNYARVLRERERQYNERHGGGTAINK